jgi:hypothetical protein
MPAAPALAVQKSSLPSRVAALRDEHAALWRRTADDPPILGPHVSLWRHVRNQRAATRLIDDLSAEATRVPQEPDRRRAWQEDVRERLQRFGDERLGWPAGYRRLIFGDGYFNASTSIARAARAFDPTIPLDDLWQAMRNVWIGNSLQMLLRLPVRSTPALFAYSMLYPLSDNLLDNPAIEGRAKRAFNERFGRRLAGSPVSPANAGEAAIFDLVTMIERQFPRGEFGDVHQSLLAIHHGQVLSLTQQDDPGIGDERLLAISCEKGGTSVLADLYLVAGRPSENDERFAFGYGVALQLMDDLQDVTRDSAAGHQTIFTRAARLGPLDDLAGRLLRFIDVVLDDPRFFGPPAAFARRASAAKEAGPYVRRGDEQDLLRRNSRSLVVGAVAEQPSLFTARFRRTVSRQWPFSLRAMRRLRRRAQRRFQQTKGAAYLLADADEGRPSAV